LSGVLAVDVVDGQLVDGSSGDDVVFIAVLDRSVSLEPLHCRVVERQLTLERHSVWNLRRLLVLQLAYERETQLCTSTDKQAYIKCTLLIVIIVN